MFQVPTFMLSTNHMTTANKMFCSRCSEIRMEYFCLLEHTVIRILTVHYAQSSKWQKDYVIA